MSVTKTRKRAAFAIGLALVLGVSGGVASAAPPAERPHDHLDALFTHGGVVDLHADTALHNLPLHGDGSPGRPMRAFMGTMRAAGWAAPKVRNFTRHVTEDSLRAQGGGVQVFSAVTRGLPPAYKKSAELYTRWFGKVPAATAKSDVALWLSQAAWVHGEVAKHPDLLALAPDLPSTVSAIQQRKVGAQLAIEGAFPFEPTPENAEAVRRFFADPNRALPATFPRPTAAELEGKGLLHYAQRIGVQYVSLNHLASSCFSGSDMWPNKARGAGLSDRGRRLIADAQDAGIMLDLAHASHQAQRDAIGVVRSQERPLPLLVSHAVFATKPADENWRTSLPEVLDVVRETGGVVGIIGARAHLPHGGSRDAEPVVADIVDQIDFVRARVGVDHVALGLDGDGFVGLSHATTQQVAESIRGELTRRGYSGGDVAKIFGGNYLHVLARRDALMSSRAPSP